MKDIVWKKVREGWREEASRRSKLEVIRRLMDGECMPRCVEVTCKWQRRMLVKLRGRMAELRIETGRWSGLSRDEWICKNCDEDEVEDGEHFLLRCVCVAEERMGLERVMNEVVEGWQEVEDSEKVVWVVGKACANGGVRRAIERMWRRQFT